MSDIISQFGRQPQTLLSGIGQGVEQLGGNIVDLEKDRRYQGLLETAMDPSTTSQENWALALNAAPDAQKENALRTYQITENERQRLIAEEAARAKAERIQMAQNAFDADQTPANMEAVRLADPEGFKMWSEAWDAMDTLAKTQTVQSNIEVIGQIASGNIENAAETARNNAVAFFNDGDLNNDADGDKWMEFSKALKDGKGRDVYKELMFVTSAAGEIGQNALDSLFDFNADAMAYAAAGEAEALQAHNIEMGLIEKDAAAAKVIEDKRIALEAERIAKLEEKRAEEKHIVDMIKSGVGLEFGSQAQQNWGRLLAKEFDNPELATRIIDMGKIKEEGKLSPSEAGPLYMTIKKGYNNEIRPYKETLYNTRVLHDLGNAESGMADNAMITLYSLIIDNKTGVKEAEAARAASSVGKWEEIKNMYAKFIDGVLPEEGRVKLLEAARLISVYAKDQIDGYYEDYANLTEGLTLDVEMALGKPIEADDYSYFELRDYINEEFEDPKYASYLEEAKGITDYEELKAAFPETFKKFESGVKANKYSAPLPDEDWINNAGELD